MLYLTAAVASVARPKKNSNLAVQRTGFTRLPQFKWQQISIDFCGPLTEDVNGFKYLLVVMDTFSKYCVVIPTKNMEAMTVARCLFFDICLIFGFPQSILSDHASNFNKSIMPAFYEILKAHKVTTAPYNPQCNGANEVNHRFLFNIVRILCEKNQRLWVDCARVACFSWNVSTVDTLDFITPFELQFGQMANLPYFLSTQLSEPIENPRDITASNYHEHLVDLMDLYCDAFRTLKTQHKVNLNIKNQEKLKDIANIKWLQPGRLVLVYKPTSTNTDSEKASRKLLYQFSGPYRIKSVHHNAILLLNLDGTPATTQNVRNVYPYNREDDAFLARYDKDCLSQEEMLEVAGFKPGDMAIIDRSESLTQKDWNLVKIIEATANEGEFLCRFYNSYSNHKDLAKREYRPCWLKKNGDEVFQENKGHSTWSAFTETFLIQNMLFHPFSLTRKQHIPSEIVEKLMLAQFTAPVLVFEDRVPLVAMLQYQMQSLNNVDLQQPATENLGDE